MLVHTIQHEQHSKVSGFVGVWCTRVVYSSGVAAIDAVIRLLNPGDLIVCTEDMYGGTHRLFTQEWARFGFGLILWIRQIQI